MKWLNTLPNKMIYLWKNLYEAFTTQFTALKRQPIIIVVLSGVIRRKKETLCEYIDYLTKVVVALKAHMTGCSDECLRKGLRSYRMSCEKVGFKGVCTLNNLLIMAESYINYEEKLMAK